MISSATAISRAVVFFTTPTKREPSTLTSITCTSEGGASLRSLVTLGNNFAVTSPGGGSLTGLVSGGSGKLLNVTPTPTANTRQGMAIRLQNLSLWAGERLGRS